MVFSNLVVFKSFLGELVTRLYTSFFESHQSTLTPSEMACPFSMLNNLSLGTSEKGFMQFSMPFIQAVMSELSLFILDGDHSWFGSYFVVMPVIFI